MGGGEGGGEGTDSDAVVLLLRVLLEEMFFPTAPPR